MRRSTWRHKDKPFDRARHPLPVIGRSRPRPRSKAEEKTGEYRDGNPQGARAGPHGGPGAVISGVVACAEPLGLATRAILSRLAGAEIARLIAPQGPTCKLVEPASARMPPPVGCVLCRRDLGRIAGLLAEDWLTPALQGAACRPQPRRGLVLIDPPYRGLTDEFSARLARRPASRATGRFATGIYLL
jgi:hypothetical protein